jgi:VWFA-related protein
MRKRECNRLSTRLMLLLVLACQPISALAAKRMSADQLQQLLASGAAAHRTDDAIAQQLTNVELTARLSSSAFQQMVSASPGPKTQQMLRAIADASVFLDPPASEIPARPIPDVAAQRFMLSQTIHYAARTLHALPDFLATRQTEHYDDSPQPLTPGAWPARAGLAFRTQTQTPVAFRDGRETDDPSFNASTPGAAKKPSLSKVSAGKDSKKRPAPAPNVGLTSWGEFGPILEIVLVDAAKGKLGWAHWEQWDGKPVAVFQFSVDRTISHYNVQFIGRDFGERIGSSYGSANGGGPSKGQVKDSGTALTGEVAGYHGRLTIDPDTGAILRITIQADLRSSDPIQKADIMVEYGSVQIGDSQHICPTHSVSVSLSHSLYQSSPISPLVDIVETQLNDVKFTDYRRFGSEAKLIMSAADLPPSQPSASAIAANAPAAPVAAVASTEAANSAVAANPAAPSTPIETASAPPNASPSATPAATPAANESDEEVLVRDVDEMPGMNAGSDEAATTGAASITKAETPTAGNFTLKVTTRLVNLALVASDKHGKPITDLKQEEIEIYDNGRKQQLHGFHHSVPGAQSVSMPSEPSDTFTNTVSAEQSDDAPDTLILLIDESHVAYRDLTRARGELLRFLKGSHPGSRVAVYSMNEHGFHAIQDITSDHAVIEATLEKWMPSAAAVSQAEELDRRNNQQFDTVRNPNDLNSVNGNNTETPDSITSIDPQLRQMGDNPLRQALASMISLARHFAPVPGHKSMVWIAGDSVLADWDDKAVGMEKKKSHFEAAILHTKEALNEAHISLYAIDASAVQTGAVSSELANQNVMLNPVATANSRPGGQPRNTSSGRVTATMQQEMHTIQTPVRELAESTGGRAVNKGGDLKAVLDGIDQESTALYEIGFDPDTPADGKYHTLQVKIPSRKDVKLRYRSGYLYNEESGNTKERFQEAVWNPQDLAGIALTAEAEPATDAVSGPGTVKLRIAFPGLALEQKNGRWADNLYIFVAQRDDAAQKAEVSGDTLRLSLKPATYDTGMPAGIPYRHPVDVQSKLGSVRIIVVDGNSGKMGSVTMPAAALKP